MSTITVDLPRRFFEDHEERELPSGEVQKRLSKKVRVRLTREEWEELLSDARFYASSDGPREFDGAAGLAASARATVKRLEAYGLDDFEDPLHYGPSSWSHEPGKHELILREGETSFNPASTKRLLYGPARIEYRVWEDGGIDFTIFDS